MKARVLLRQIRNLIDDFDWAVVMVPSGRDKMPCCVYSIGFGPTLTAAGYTKAKFADATRICGEVPKRPCI
jgi:hypothetical protein